MNTPKLQLKHFTFPELFKPDCLQALDAKFLTRLLDHKQQLHDDLLAYRHQTRQFTPLQISELLLACAPILEEFIAELFAIESALATAAYATLANKPIFAFKAWYVTRQAKRRLNKPESIESFAELDQWLTTQLAKADLLMADKELAVALLGQRYLEKSETFAAEIELLTRWCIRALTDPLGQIAVKGWSSFHLPQKIDYQQLVPTIAVPEDNADRLEGPPENYRHRDGFKLTDSRMTARQVYNEIDYCVYCHKNEGDFCSQGFPVKKGEPDKGLKTNPLGQVQTGCPLEEKISEMHVLKRDGYTIAALAMVMVDNPMCPATGHRICNDCMKACIYQKQDPVDIPQTETGILTDVLALPWGVEIYDLLTRWNPLRQQQWVAQSYNGLKILIMGMGPAGYTLAHHLLMAGCAVVGTDGLKIEPLSSALIEQPIYRYDDIKEALDDRITAGFGGVAEYGITVRWDKNFLKLIYISLMRRPHFQVFGNVRFGGTLKVEDAWRLGFDHMAIAVGAGLPKELAIPGSLAPGMRQANDFLMALQLTGAAKKNSLTNLQVRLPAVIIGGGLTGIDTATEVQAYYIVQVEKALTRYEQLVKIVGETQLRQQFDKQSLIILDEFLAHGRLVRAERKRAEQANEKPNFIALIRSWGGVTVAYRGLLTNSPAYRYNHEEVIKALEEGIYYAEGIVPKAARLDEQGQVSALISEQRTMSEQKQWITVNTDYILSARSIFIATGAKPNIAYEFEHRGTFHREGSEYQAYDNNGDLKPIHAHSHCKTPEFGAFTSYQQQGYRVTFLGDTHPVFHGSVVKAIASAKRTYPKIMQLFAKKTLLQGDSNEYKKFAETMRTQFTATITQLKRLNAEVLELVIQAPIAAHNFLPGQFYRVQNYETHAQILGDTLLQIEAIAMLATNVDEQRGLISFILFEQGASSRLFSTFKVGQAIALMGPTGVRTKIPQDQETILIIGGRLAAAHLLAVGSAMRAAGNRVLYIGSFNSANDVYCQRELEAATDKIIWITETGQAVAKQRSQDYALTSDLISAIMRYANGELDQEKTATIPLQTVDRILAIGSQKFLRIFQEAKQTLLKDYFIKNPLTIASVYGPMQCMLKGVCAQCLTWQIDPTTGKRTKAIFTCSWHDQPLDMVDLENLDERLSQNRMQEKLTNLWLDYLFTHHKIPRI